AGGPRPGRRSAWAHGRTRPPPPRNPLAASGAGAGPVGERAAGDALVALDVPRPRGVDDLVGQGRGRWALVPVEAVEVVPHRLLVERWWGGAGLPLVRGPEARRVRRQDLVGQHQLAVDETELELGVGDEDPP